jgi:hypothetical protein
MNKEWWIDYIRSVLKNEFHGKIILNACASDIPSIEKQERINKPKEDNPKIGKEG